MDHEIEAIETEPEAYEDGKCINSYEQGYRHGRQDVNFKSKGLDRFQLSGMWDQEYAAGYRHGQKEARSALLTDKQKAFLTHRARETPKPFNCMANFPHA